jgi:hypothetical protein
MIDRQNLMKVVSEWQIYDLPETIERDLDVPVNLDLIISIIGPRRAGKTFLMYDLIKKLLTDVPKNNILYINFENENLTGMKATDLDDLISVFFELSNPSHKFPIYLFMDEIQVVENWSRWVNRIYETKRYKVFISGSSSKLLSRELATQLRGRTLDFTVLPFSFHEFLSFKSTIPENMRALLLSSERGRILSQLNEYMLHGGYPEIVRMNEYKDRLLHSYVDAMIIKDVGERFHIEPSVLNVFVNYCLRTYSKQVSGTKIYNYLKSMNFSIAHDFPLKLLDHFSEVFFLYTVKILSHSFKNSSQYPKKLYVVDTGLINEMTRTVETGKLMENIVYLELYRRMNNGNRFQINYWREYGKAEGMEVDFVISSGDKAVELINVTYAGSEHEILERENKSLLKASMDLNCNKLTIITWDFWKEGVINYIPLWYWLLN